jgi:hypothetical protein
MRPAIAAAAPNLLQVGRRSALVKLGPPQRYQLKPAPGAARSVRRPVVLGKLSDSRKRGLVSFMCRHAR